MGLIHNENQTSMYDYDTAWIEVEKLIDSGLPKSALNKIEEIYKVASDEENDPQFAKSIIYLSRVSIQTDENGIEKAIQRLELIIKSIDRPVRYISASYLAELYQNYFDNYRWEISQRSELMGEQSADFKTWSTQQFLTTIEKWYLFSIENKKSINIPIEEYKIILNKYDREAFDFRPTLYEVLADRVFHFYNIYGIYWGEQAQSFRIDQSWYFSPVDTFINKEIPSIDKISAKYKLLNLYQDVLRTQISAKNFSALADYDIGRLEYVHSNSTLEDKDSLYINSLDYLAEKTNKIPFHSEIAAKLATFLLSQTDDSLANVKVIKICDDAIKLYPKSTGAGKCRNLINTIKQPFGQLYGESVYPACHQMIFALDYNNIGSAEIETVKLGNDFDEIIRKGDQEEIRKYLVNAKKVNTISLKLNSSSLFRSQRMEFSHDKLPFGQYALILSTNKNSQEIFQYLIFNISDLAYITYHADKKRVIIVSDRTSGKSVKGVKVTLMSQNYNPGNRQYEFVPTGDFVTDSEGKVTINNHLEQNIKIKLSYKKDILDLNQYHYNYKRYENSETNFAEFFTDRSIYRPGQIVFFKAILLKKDKNQIPSILPNKSVDVILRDANYQEIAKQSLVSNDFGSVNGSFTIPLGKLNGIFSLSIQSESIYGQKNIRIEEYKRPTFEVLADPFKGEFRLNDSIKVSGKAMTLAGSSVDGANVNYKIVRMARFPSWGWWWRMPYPSAEFLISQGETITDAEGKFAFSFKSLPDLKVEKKSNPVFSYRVEIDITDQNGETRSTSTVVSAANNSFSLTTNMKKEQDLESMDDLKIKATNTNGQTLVVKGSLKIFLLEEAKFVQINKYWDGKTDYPIPMKMAEKYFPQYPAGPETDVSSWKIEKQVFKSDFNTLDSFQIKSILTHGVYKIEIESKDKNGDKITAEQYMIVSNFSANKFPKTSYVFFRTNQEVLEPGEVFKLSMGATEKAATVHILFEKDGRALLEKTICVDKKGEINFPVTENHRGGFNVKLTYILSNRVFSKDYYVDIPWTNKQLSITFNTFRDKTLPGSQEEYSIKISGPKQDKIAAEMVASMYDASLDQFESHEWRKEYYPRSYASLNVEVPGFNMVSGRYYGVFVGSITDTKMLIYPAMIPLTTYYMGGESLIMTKSMRTSAKGEPAADMLEVVPQARQPESPPTDGNTKEFDESDSQPTDKSQIGNQEFAYRKNLKETVFFFPELKTDSEGNIILTFKMNEALTKWRLMSFAHTLDFMTGYDERVVQTQKNLMVFPNAPRFIRDGDMLSFTAKVSNLSDRTLHGNSTLQILDAVTMVDITKELVKTSPILNFDIEQGRSAGLVWDLLIPDTKYHAITYRISAQAGGHSDGEENTIPVITNRILLTESMPMAIKGNESKTFVFKAFENNSSTTKKDFRYTIEYTSNPVWYAIQALPYMSEQINAGTQALVDKFYANALASKIANAHPRIKAIIDLWQIKDKEALLSNLSKNQDLKSAILEETPWVRQALSESEQKRNIAILFDINKMVDEKRNTIIKLQERQLSNGGFPWFSGGRDDIYTTQNIMENIGHLGFLGALEKKDANLDNIIVKALQYMDTELISRYEKLKENIKLHGGSMADDHIDELSLHYLYVRTFFKSEVVNETVKEANEYYFMQAKKYWLKRNLYSQAMIGLILHRNNDATVYDILKSLKERSFRSDELGMYWNEGNGFYWYQLPIERHALLLELFSDAGVNQEDVDLLKIWLLKNKQTNHWKTTKSTAAAIYSLLLQGEKTDISAWVTESSTPEIRVGNDDLKSELNNTEAGTGYVKKSYSGENISKNMATIKIRNNNKSIAWGAAYYQYFEQMDKVTTFKDTPLKLNKKLYKVLRTDKGDLLEEIKATTLLKPGDKIKVRIELYSDRQMEYVHMKDMRPSGLEPINVISEYKYQGQLGYYETTKDLATHFYFNYLPKGTFVFEYPLIAVHKGDFSGGITNIESMYAPEFGSHSEGVRVIVR